MKSNRFMQYNNKLILELLKSNVSGIVAANIIAMIITVGVLYSYVPNSYLSLFFLLHISLALFRLYIGKQLFISINTNNTYKKKNLSLYAIITATTALSYGTMAFLGILYSAPDTNIFIIGLTLTTISAGSLATLASIYVVFLLFILFSLLPFIFVLLFHGGIAFYIFAFILFVYFIVNSVSGYRMYLNHQASFLLKEKFKTIYDNSSDGIVLIKNNRFTECNQAAIKIFGYATNMQEFLSTELFKLMPPVQEDGKNSMKKMLQMLKKTSQGAHTFEWMHLKKNGEIFYVDITLSLISINEEILIHGIWRDITYRKKIENEIISLNKNLKNRIKGEVAKNREKDKAMLQQSRLAQMGEMIRMIAHQWRQPLSAISATSGNLTLKAKLDMLDNDTAVELGERISGYAQHLSLTIDDFRDFFKSNKETLDTTYKELIDSVLSIIETSITDKNIQLKQELQSEVTLSTYPNEIKQVILNLIKNAEDILLEKGIENPYIKIKTYDDENNSYLSVEDNGGGIPEDIIDKIFDPYFSTKTKKDGTGLGLYMSKTIIEEHCRGKLMVSNGDDGAKFTIILQNNIPKKGD